MRIALLIRDLGYAGAQRQLVALAIGLRQAGHEVSVLCFYGGGMQADLEAAKVTVIGLGKRHRYDIAGFLWRLISSVRAARPDILYSFLTESNVLAAALRLVLPQTRLIWGLRDSESDAALYGLVGRSMFGLSRLLSSVPNLHIANSHSGATYYAGQGYPADRITVVANGIDTQRFQPSTTLRQHQRQQLGITDQDCLVGIIGRLSPMKDYATFLQAIATLGDHRQLRFLCVGTGSAEYTQSMHTMAQELGLAERITWLAPQHNMPSLLNGLDLLVSSSAYGEGFSNVVGEAMACGVPCVVTDVGDSARLVQGIGYVAPARNPEALGQAIRQFIQLSPAEQDLRRQQSRERMTSLYTVPNMVGNSAAILDAIHQGLPIPSHVAAANRRQRLLFTITALGTGGAEMMLTQLIGQINQQRYEVQVISLTQGGKYADKLKEMGIPVYDLGLSAGRVSLKAIWRLRQHVRHYRPDLIVGWMYHGNLAATLSSWMARHVPVIWNVRQSLYSLALEKRGSAMVIRLLAKLGFQPQQILYNSDVSRQQHEAIGYPAEKSVLVPMASTPQPSSLMQWQEPVSWPSSDYPVIASSSAASAGIAR